MRSPHNEGERSALILAKVQRGGMFAGWKCSNRRHSGSSRSPSGNTCGHRREERLHVRQKFYYRESYSSLGPCQAVTGLFGAKMERISQKAPFKGGYWGRDMGDGVFPETGIHENPSATRRGTPPPNRYFRTHRHFSYNLPPPGADIEVAGGCATGHPVRGEVTLHVDPFGLVEIYGHNS